MKQKPARVSSKQYEKINLTGLFQLVVTIKSCSDIAGGFTFNSPPLMIFCQLIDCASTISNATTIITVVFALKYVQLNWPTRWLVSWPRSSFKLHAPCTCGNISHRLYDYLSTVSLHSRKSCSFSSASPTASALFSYSSSSSSYLFSLLFSNA